MRPAEIFYRRAEANEALVWRVCEYTSVGGDDCEHCPAWQDEPGHGRYKKGCRALAEEVIAIVLEDGNRP